MLIQGPAEMLVQGPVEMQVHGPVGMQVQGPVGMLVHECDARRSKLLPFIDPMPKFNLAGFLHNVMGNEFKELYYYFVGEFVGCYFNTNHLIHFTGIFIHLFKINDVNFLIKMSVIARMDINASVQWNLSQQENFFWPVSLSSRDQRWRVLFQTQRKMKFAIWMHLPKRRYNMYRQKICIDNIIAILGG